MAHYALRLPESLLQYARSVAQEEKVSMNQFFVTAIAEKLSALKTESYLRERLTRADAAAFDAWLDASPAHAALAGDELPPPAASAGGPQPRRGASSPLS